MIGTHGGWARLAHRPVYSPAVTTIPSAMTLLPAFYRARSAVIARTCVPALLAAVCLHSQAGQAAPAVALVKVDHAWIRASVKGQSGTGGFMDLTASQNLTLTGLRSPIAKDSALHEMAMDDGGVMRMRAVESLALPSGQTVSLRPGMGGHHVMLMGLTRPLKEGDKVELTLLLQAADGKRLKQKVLVPVKKEAAPSGQQDMPHEHHDHDHGAMGGR